MLLLAVLLVYCTIAVGIDPESGGLVQRLISQREELVQVHDRHHHHHNNHDHDCVHDHDHDHDHDQAGLSYTNSSSPLLMPMTLADVQRLAHTSQVMMMTNVTMMMTMMVMTWPVLASVVIMMLLRNGEIYFQVFGF